MQNTTQGKWKQVRGKVKEQWGELTNDDLDKIDGREDQLVGKLQERYGKDQARAQREVNDFFDRLA